MISSSKEKVGASSSTKQESTQDGKNNSATNAKASSSISTSSPWSRLKDSRIVRVSRAFGGKDRHSKVCTIRGLRDRRVRLSVPTAIELYDLQDRLGLNQPSKVVDWLLNAAKDEIDELPPLPIPPGSFPHLIAHQTRLSTGTNSSLWLGSSCSKQEFKNMMNNSTTSTSSMNWEEDGDNNAGFWNLKGVERRDIGQELGNEKGNWMSTKRNNDDEEEEEDKQEMIGNESQSSFLNRGGLNFPYGTSFFQLESQSFNPLSSSSSSPHHHHIGSSSGHLVPFPSPLSLSSTSYFPNSASAMEIDPRQISHFQMLTNSSPTPYSMAQSMRPFHFSMSQPPDDLHKHNHGQEFDQN